MSAFGLQFLDSCCCFAILFNKLSNPKLQNRSMKSSICSHLGVFTWAWTERCLELQSQCSISSSLKFAEGTNVNFCIQKPPTQLPSWCSTLLMPSQAAESLNSPENTTAQPLWKSTLARIPVNFANIGAERVFSFRPSHEFICNVILLGRCEKSARSHL